MPSESELFSIDYPDHEPEEVWQAVRSALITMDLRDPDDASRTARFSSGVSSTSWGEHMIAVVTPGSAGGAHVTVWGRPKHSFLTTKVGEDVHARQVKKDLRESIGDALSQTY